MQKQISNRERNTCIYEKKEQLHVLVMSDSRLSLNLDKWIRARCLIHSAIHTFFIISILMHHELFILIILKV